MKKLSSADEIWCLNPTKEDLIVGANYAAITLPWTFNRMMLNTNSKGQQSRGINIAKGIVVQEVIRRELEKRGIKTRVQRKSHRDSDLFDLKVVSRNKLLKLDLKSFHYFTNYPGDVRQRLTPELIIENKNYFGPDWRKFFPMLIAHTQISQGKDVYCFAVSRSLDMRVDRLSNRSENKLTAFPYGEHLGFLCSKQLCLEREKDGLGFYVDLKYRKIEELFITNEIELTILGEWKDQLKKNQIRLKPGENKTIGPFSCFNSVQISKKSYLNFQGSISVFVSKNELQKVFLNTLKKNINLAPKGELIFKKEDFCNLILPNDFKVYYLGWIEKDNFIEACKNYMGWVWPRDSVSKFENQPWSQFTESDIKKITAKGFNAFIQKNPNLLKAGWLKTSGRGAGACCYVFPNTYGGGVKETNLYVLPKDLHPMDDLKGQ